MQVKQLDESMHVAQLPEHAVQIKVPEAPK
jgi:hypothetical protein